MGAEDLKAAQFPSDVPITRREVVSHDAPSEWLDRLLVARCELAPSAGVEEAMTHLLDAASAILGEVAVGVCVVSAGDQVVVRRALRASFSRPPDPTKLFSEYAYERVVAIPLDDNSTLHLASDEPDRFAGGRADDQFVERLALVLGSAIRHCRAYAAASQQSAEMRALQAQVIHSERLASLGQIAAGIVHELNNPLTSIVAYSDYLHKKTQRGGGDPADAERLRRINEAAERILRFSRDLIAYARPSAEIPAPVVIHDVVERALVFCEHVLEENGVVVERSFGAVEPVSGVPGQLTQVFVNLFTNAAHAMAGRGGTLVIATTMPSETEVLISVLDDGHGIDSDHLSRIFEPFFTTKTDGSGTGLGLSIVRNIMASHGGRIRAERRAPRGTAFLIALPVAAHPQSEP